MIHNSLVLPTSLVAIAAFIWAFQALISLLSGRKLNQIFAATLFGIPCLCLIVAALTGWNHDYVFAAPAALSFGHILWQQKLDSLACAFIGLLGFVGLAVSFYSPGYLSHLKDRIHLGQYWASIGLFMMSMMMVVLSANAVTFLVFWEIMSCSSLALVASEHKEHEVQRASLIYLGATRIATAFLTVGFLIMYTHFHSWEFSAWHLAGAHNVVLPSILILLGCCIKAGIWPFHVWLPYAHPAAPSPVSALMSGVMIKIAIYAIIRVLVGNGSDSIVVAYVAFGLGLISSFWGVLFALVQHDLKKLLAFSSVENVGLILLGIGVALLARPTGHSVIGTLALAAAIFHALNHGLFKALLFLGVGALDASVHTRDLRNLGGLAAKMPWTSACFLLGSAAICALPPLNGFASKWMLYQSLFRTTWVSSLSALDRGVALASLGVLGLVGGLALATFTKAFGIAFLGKARSRAVATQAHEVGTGMKLAQVILAVSCLVVGLAARPLTSQLSMVSAGLLGVAVSHEVAFPIPIAVFSLSLIGIVLIVYMLFLSPNRVRRHITWECGFGEALARAQATSISYSQPLARIFNPALRSELSVNIVGSDKRHFPEVITFEPELGKPLENLVYRPATEFIQYLAKWFNKLQTGSVHLYLLYVCITLVALLFIGIRL